MKIEHIGIWVQDLEVMKTFYENYFQATSNALYHNQTTGFRSYFLSFATGGRLELMHKDQLVTPLLADCFGYAHLAMAVGDKQAVDQLVARLQADGFALINGPRTTGDGYYEAVIQDPEGNLVEIMAE